MSWIGLSDVEEENDRLQAKVESLRYQVDTLRAENERLRGELGQAWDHCVTVCGEREARLRHETWAREQAEARTRALEAALETAANRLDIAASVIRSGAEFARWAAEARAVPLWRAGDE